METAGFKSFLFGRVSSDRNRVWTEALPEEFKWKLRECENSKLAIVGILGDRNSGKSFLLNVMAEYLRSEEEGKHSWIVNLTKSRTSLLEFEMLEQKKKSSNFSEGIYMWSEPFILKKPADYGAEEKVVVILLDINMREVNSELEILMCLLCSTLIYNKVYKDSPDISRILELKNAVLKCKSFFLQSTPNDVAFQNMTIVFRDSNSVFKCGEDKSLKYLSDVMRRAPNRQWTKGFDYITEKTCFLLKKPEENFFDGQGRLQDSNFAKQIKALTENVLNIDCLPLKTWKGGKCTIKELSSVFECVNYLTPKVQQQLTTKSPLEISLPNEASQGNQELSLLETNLDEPMEVDNEVENPSQDVEMRDVSQNHVKIQEIETDELRKQGEQFRALTQTKLTEEECKGIDDKFQTVDKRSSGSHHPQDTVSDSSINQLHITVKIKKILDFVMNDAFQEVKRTSLTKLDEVLLRLRQEGVKKAEVVLAENHISNPTEPLQLIEDAIDSILNGIKELKAATHQTKHNTQCTGSYVPEEKLSDNLVNFLKSYTESMDQCLATEMATTKVLNNNCEESGMEQKSSITNDTHLEVQASTKQPKTNTEKLPDSMQIDKLIKTSLSHINRHFANACAQLITTGRFLEKKPMLFFEELFENAIANQSLSYDAVKKVQDEIKKLDQTKKCIRRLENMQRALKDVLVQTKKKFQCHNILNADQIESLAEYINSIGKDIHLDDIETKCLRIVIDECKKANDLIIQHELTILTEDVYPRIKNFYDKEMKFLTQNVMTAEQLHQAHAQLKRECANVVKNSCTYNHPLTITCIKSAFEELQRTLDDSFHLHSENNQRKIEMKMVKIRLVVQKAQSRYVDLMTKRINGRIVQPRQLEVFSKDCLGEVTGILKVEMKNLGEDPQHHNNSLEVQIKRSYESFVETNTIRIKLEEEKREMEKREQKKQEAIEKKLAKEKEAVSASNRTGKADQIANTSDSTGNSNKFSSRDDCKGRKTEKKDRPMIAIEFGMNIIKCGIFLEEKLTVIPDRWNNHHFPNLIAVSEKDEILIGHEVEGYTCGKKTEYRMIDILLIPSHELSSSPLPPIFIKGEERQLTKELLCGLILARIKSDAEAFLECEVHSAVITVPLWYTSSQRQATKDAAIIGGFSSVHLINETTAAVLAYANQESRVGNSNDFMVVVANNDSRFDVALYDYKYGKVKMESCSGNLHFKNLTLWSNPAKKMQDWLKYTFGEEQRQSMRSILEDCVDREYINEFALICDENEIQRYDNIKKLVLSYCREATKLNNAILQGAARFAKLLCEDEKRARSYVSDLLPYEVQFFRKPASNKATGIAIPRHERLPKTVRTQSCPFESNEDINFEISEMGYPKPFLGWKFILPIIKRNNKSKVKVEFTFNHEGIITIKAYEDSPPKQEIALKIRSCNMTKEEITTKASLVASLIKNPKLEERRVVTESSKIQLQELAEYLLKSLNEVQSVFGKDQLEKRAESALEALNHPRITVEDVQNRIVILMKLKSKYLS